MASVPFQFDLAGVRVNGMIKKITPAERIAYRNDVNVLTFRGETVGTEPNVARAINRVLSDALEDPIYIDGHKTKIDQGQPLKYVYVEDNDEFNDYITDDLLTEIVKVNEFLGREGNDKRPNPLAQIFRPYAPEPDENPTKSQNGTGTGSSEVASIRSGPAGTSSTQEG